MSNANSSTWQNTTLTGQNISLKAEGDTTLRGATATADRIDIKTGGTLTIESLQDVAEDCPRGTRAWKVIVMDTPSCEMSSWDWRMSIAGSKQWELVVGLKARRRQALHVTSLTGYSTPTLRT